MNSATMPMTPHNTQALALAYCLLWAINHELCHHTNDVTQQALALAYCLLWNRLYVLTFFGAGVSILFSLEV